MGAAPVDAMDVFQATSGDLHVDLEDKENSKSNNHVMSSIQKSPGLLKRLSVENVFKSPAKGGGKKRKVPFEVLTDSVLNSPRPKPMQSCEKVVSKQSQEDELLGGQKEQQQLQDNDNTTTDSILATRKSKRRKSMARRVSFAPDHSLNKLCVYERDQESDFEGDKTEGEEEVKSKKRKAKSVFGFDTSNMFSALQSPSGSERTTSSAGASLSLKTTDTADTTDSIQDVSSRQEEPASLVQPPQQVEALELESFDGGIKVVMDLQDDDTVGITFTGDLTGSLPGLTDLVQEDETTGNQSNNPLPTDTLDTIGPGDTLEALENVNAMEGGDTTNLFAETTDEVDMDVTGKLPDLSSLIDVDERQEEEGEAGNAKDENQAAAPPSNKFGLDSPELLAAVNNLNAETDVTMDLTENITLNLPDLSNLVQEDEELNVDGNAGHKEKSDTPVKDSNTQQNHNAVGSSTKKQAEGPFPQDEFPTATFTNDQEGRWGFKPGAVDTLEMDLTQNGVNLMGEKTFHAVYRPSMGTATMACMPDINEVQQTDAQTDSQEEEEEAHVLTFHEFLQEADVQFLDFLRRGTSFGAANLANNFEEPKGLMECMELIYVTSPELSMLEKGCATLQEDVHQRKFQLADKERHLNCKENQPGIFDAIQIATGEKLVDLKFDVQQLKRCCRQQTSQAWKEWRAKLEGKALGEMFKVRSVLEQDLVNLKENMQNLQDMFSESSSLTDHVNQQVANLMKEASTLKESEEECTALAKECDNVQARCGKLDELFDESTSKLDEISSKKEQLLKELKALEDQVSQKQAQLDAKQGSAEGTNGGSSSLKIEVSELMSEWDMMVALTGGEGALNAVMKGIKEGKRHMSISQSTIRRSIITNFYEKEIERCMQKHLGNVLIERANESTIQINVVDSLKGLKISFDVSNFSEGESCAVLNRKLCVAPDEIVMKVDGTLTQRKGLIPLTQLVNHILACF